MAYNEHQKHCVRSEIIHFRTALKNSYYLNTIPGASKCWRDSLLRCIREARREGIDIREAMTISVPQ